MALALFGLVCSLSFGDIPEDHFKYCPAAYKLIAEASGNWRDKITHPENEGKIKSVKALKVKPTSIQALITTRF